MEKLLAGPVSCARVICGDFNSAIPTGQPVAAWFDTQGFADVALNGSTWAEPANACHLDHVCYTTSHLRVEAAHCSISAQDIAEGMPNPRQPSDHAPVVVTLTFL